MLVVVTVKVIYLFIFAPVIHITKYVVHVSVNHAGNGTYAKEALKLEKEICVCCIMHYFCGSVSSFCLRCNTESEWFQIHENIIKKANSRYNLSGSNTGKDYVFLIHFAPSHLHLANKGISSSTSWLL